jgi:hypothetical protein
MPKSGIVVFPSMDTPSFADACSGGLIANCRGEIGCRGADRNRIAFSGNDVFYSDRDAVNRAQWIAFSPTFFGCCCLEQRSLGVNDVHRVKLWLAGFNARQHIARHLDRRELSSAERI